jgi:hypothetical protein
MKERLEGFGIVVVHGFALVCFYTGLFVVLRSLWYWFVVFFGL